MKESRAYTFFLHSHRKLLGFGLLTSVLITLGLYLSLPVKHSVAVLYEIVPEQGSLSDNPEKYSLLTDELVSLLRQEQITLQLMQSGVSSTIYKDLPIGIKIEFSGQDKETINQSIQKTTSFATQKALSQYQLKLIEQGQVVGHQSKGYLFPYLALLLVSINLCTLFVSLLQSYFKNF